MFEKSRSLIVKFMSDLEVFFCKIALDACGSFVVPHKF